MTILEGCEIDARCVEQALEGLARRANQLTQYLSGIPAVREVELRGSLIGGRPTLMSGIHLAVTVDQESADLWQRLVVNTWKRDNEDGDSLRDLRQLWALCVLGVTWVEIDKATQTFWLERDIFLLPPDWKDHLVELGMLWHEDTSFAKNFM